MSTYAIGDVQGCFKTLNKLLEHINFDPASDSLWFAGDLVNRGPQSLETLRFVKQLGNKHHTVLGNHDLHLLARSHATHEGWKDDTLNDILQAPDKKELLDWLQHLPLIHHDAELGYTMVHAGFAKNWDLSKAQQLAKEVENVLRSDKASDYFHHMYGNQPDQWDEKLTGFDRLRCITNFFTRERFCFSDGRMDLKFDGTLESAPKDLLPWYQVPDRANAELNILFGHWAALGGITNTEKVFALDTGCVWGFDLTAMRLEDQKRFKVASVETDGGLRASR
jgi:bis(5'-nucleosyl)-tetraphosphatase (symmetrical)